MNPNLTDEDLERILTKEGLHAGHLVYQLAEELKAARAALAVLRPAVTAARELIDDISGGDRIEFECGSVYRFWDLADLRAHFAKVDALTALRSGA